MLYKNNQLQIFRYLLNHIFQVKVILKDSLFQGLFQQLTTEHTFTASYEPIKLYFKDISIIESLI